MTPQEVRLGFLRAKSKPAASHEAPKVIFDHNIDFNIFIGIKYLGATPV